MQELKTDPNQPGIDRMIDDFGPIESYHESGSYPEVRHKTREREEDEDRGRWGSAPCIYQELRWDPPL